MTERSALPDGSRTSQTQLDVGMIGGALDTYDRLADEIARG